MCVPPSKATLMHVFTPLKPEASETTRQVTFPFDENQPLTLTNQDVWQLSQKVYQYFTQQSTDLESHPVERIHKLDCSFDVVVSRHFEFWKRYQFGKWKPNTFHVLDEFLSPECTYIDIGAWIGHTALYGAQFARVTYAFEPDPLAFQELQQNVEVNKTTPRLNRLHIHNKAISDKRGTVRLGSRNVAGKSRTSVLYANETTYWEAEAETLDQFLEDNPPANRVFLKIDIEGGEYDLLPSLKKVFKRYPIDLFLSLHPQLLFQRLNGEKSRSLLRRMIRRWRAAYKHVKTIRALPFKYLYSSSGKEWSSYKELIKACLLNRFTMEVIGTDKPWFGISAPFADAR